MFVTFINLITTVSNVLGPGGVALEENEENVIRQQKNGGVYF